MTNVQWELCHKTKYLFRHEGSWNLIHINNGSRPSRLYLYMFVCIHACIYVSYNNQRKKEASKLRVGGVGGVQRRVTRRKKLDGGKERKWCHSISIKKHFIKTHEGKEKNKMRNSLKMHGISPVSSMGFMSHNQKKLEKERGQLKRVANSLRRQGCECVSVIGNGKSRVLLSAFTLQTCVPCQLHQRQMPSISQKPRSWVPLLVLPELRTRTHSDKKILPDTATGVLTGAREAFVEIWFS